MHCIHFIAVSVTIDHIAKHTIVFLFWFLFVWHENLRQTVRHRTSIKSINRQRKKNIRIWMKIRIKKRVFEWVECISRKSHFKSKQSVIVSVCLCIQSIPLDSRNIFANTTNLFGFMYSWAIGRSGTSKYQTRDHWVESLRLLHWITVQHKHKRLTLAHGTQHQPKSVYNRDNTKRADSMLFL